MVLDRLNNQPNSNADAAFATIRGPETINELGLGRANINSIKHVCLGWGTISLGDWSDRLTARKKQMTADCINTFGENKVGVISVARSGDPNHLGPRGILPSDIDNAMFYSLPDMKNFVESDPTSEKAKGFKKFEKKFVKN